jgi:hypothetical protein
VSHTISLTPETFTLVKYDAAEVLALAQDAADAVGVPDDVSIAIEVDEALPGPLAASAVEAADSSMTIWFSGGSFEDPKVQAVLDPEMTRAALAAAFLRGRDRVSGGFTDAPNDSEISERQRAIWDTYAEGRLVQMGGFTIREARRLYTFRLQCGFNDVADAEYDRIWKSDSLSWTELEAIDAKLIEADGRPQAKKSLRRESLRPA